MVSFLCCSTLLPLLTKSTKHIFTSIIIKLPKQNSHVTYSTMIGHTNKKGTPERFPFRLHRMIDEAEEMGRDDLICWLPCGTKFCIGNQTIFATTIMSKYCRHDKYKSFLRQLSMYKFSRVSSAGLAATRKGSVTYMHPHFLRNRMDLAEHINRENIQDIPKKLLVPGKASERQTKASTTTAVSVVSLEDSERSFSITDAKPGNNAKFWVSQEPRQDKIDIFPGTHHIPTFMPITNYYLTPSATTKDILDEIILTFLGAEGQSSALTTSIVEGNEQEESFMASLHTLQDEEDGMFALDGISFGSGDLT